MNHTTERGFTLLLASLIASIVLILGTAMYELASREVALSSIGRDSQFAFYAADGAAECGLYYDIRREAFSTSSPPETVLCDGQTIPVTHTAGNSGSEIFSFQYEPNARCAKVTVTKNTSNPRTVIDASGYNTKCVDIDTSDRALERSVELHY